MPRVVVKMNTGTRTMKSKKDKANTRQNLNKRTREEINKSFAEAHEKGRIFNFDFLW